MRALYILAYVLGTFALVFFLMSTMRTLETFAPVVDSQKCFQCMDYFESALSVADPNEVVSHVQQRAKYIHFVLWDFMDLAENLKCKPQDGKELTVMDIQRCILERVDFLSKECVKDQPRSECTIISRLADRLITESLKCGATPCTVADFIGRFKTALKAMIADLETCRREFDRFDMQCVKLYGQVIQTKNQPTTSTLTTEDSKAHVTENSMRNQMGDMTSFVMNNM